MPKSLQREVTPAPDVPPATSRNVLNDDDILPVDGESADAIDADEVTREAYALYQERGYVDGHDFDDWVEAERRVRERNGRSSGRGADRQTH